MRLQKTRENGADERTFFIYLAMNLHKVLIIILQIKLYIFFIDTNVMIQIVKHKKNDLKSHYKDKLRFRN